MGLELFDDRPIQVGLLVENNWLKVQPLRDPRDGLLGLLVVHVDKEDFSAQRPNVLWESSSRPRSPQDS